MCGTEQNSLKFARCPLYHSKSKLFATNAGTVRNTEKGHIHVYRHNYNCKLFTRR